MAKLVEGIPAGRPGTGEVSRSFLLRVHGIPARHRGEIRAFSFSPRARAHFSVRNKDLDIIITDNRDVIDDENNFLYLAPDNALPNVRRDADRSVVVAMRLEVMEVRARQTN